MKDWIAPLDGAVAAAVLEALPVYGYHMKGGDVRLHGGMAQEWQPVIPEAVSLSESEAMPDMVDYTKVIPYLIAALQHANRRIATLEASIGS